MRERTCGRLCPGIDPMTNRSALHEDDRMVAIFAGDGRGQARDELRLRPADDLLETLSGQVVAFVDDEMSVVSDQVTHDVLSHQALDDRHVQRAGRLLAPAADSADGLGRQPQKRRQSLDPLFLQLPAMHENERIDAALGDQPCGDDGLSKGGRGGRERRCRGPAGRGRPSLARDATRPGTSTSSGLPALRSSRITTSMRRSDKQRLDLVQATPWQTDVLRHGPRHRR